MHRPNWLAIALAIVLYPGLFVFGQEEKKETPRSGHAMPHHMRMMREHATRHAGGASAPDSCLMCRTMLWSASAVREILDEQEELGLTAVQVRKLKDMDVAYSMAQIDRRAALEKKLIQLRRVFDSDPVDLAVLEETLYETADAWIDMVVAWVEVKQEAIALLTEEQKENLERLREEAATAMREGPSTKRKRRRASVEEAQPGG